MSKSQLYSSHIEVLHVELTNRCNARCPMCSRTDNPTVEDNPSDITLEDFQRMFPVEFLSKLRVIIFCGNFGDPAAARDCVEIHEYALSANPNIHFFMHTNGGTRSVSFWESLGNVYSRAKGIINFHIDGLEDTNQQYRVGVDYNKAMRNAEAAIAAGAVCNWMFIPFEYNQHQIAQAQAISKEKGFGKFVQIITARFGPEPQPMIWVNRKTGEPNSLAPTTLPELQLINQPKPLITPKCRSMKLNELFVSSRGIAMPCCWLSSIHELDPEFRRKSIVDTDSDLNERSIYDVLEDPMFQEAVPQSWKSRNYISETCKNRCTQSSPTQEWIVDGVHVTEDDMINWISTI